nr:hypothetical protein [Litorihabitans aurantiacus]
MAVGGRVPGGAGPARARATASPTRVGTLATTTASRPSIVQLTIPAPARDTATAASPHASPPAGDAATSAAVIAPRSAAP